MDRVYHDLDALAGTWSEEDYKEFEENTKYFESMLTDTLYQSILCEADATGNTFLILYHIDPKDINFTKILKERNLDSALFISFLRSDQNHLYFKMRVLEKDGSESSFCGNGSRALSRFFLKKFGKGYTFHLEKDIVLSKSEKGYAFTCPLPRPESIEPIKMEGYTFYKVSVSGEPHFVTFDPLSRQELEQVGKKITGVNINVVKVLDEKHLANTTFERGVNAITKACGSGSLSAFTIANALSLIGDEVTVKTKGGLLYLKKEEGKVTSSGAAKIFY